MNNANNSLTGSEEGTNKTKMFSKTMARNWKPKTMRNNGSFRRWSTMLWLKRLEQMMRKNNQREVENKRYEFD